MVQKLDFILTVSLVIVSCFILHNVATDIDDRSFDDEAEGVDINVGVEQNGEEEIEQNNNKSVSSSNLFHITGYSTQVVY